MLKKIFKVIIAGLIFGILMSFLKHNGFWFKIIEGFKVIPIYLYPIFIFGAIFFNIFFHEFGHLVGFLINGIKIKLISVLFVSVGKNYLGKWKIKMNFKLIKNVGGIVIPNIKKINNDIEYENVRRKIAKALIAGPNASIIYIVFSFLTFWSLVFFSNFFLLIGIMGVNLLITIPLFAVIILSAKVEMDNIYGDYAAYNKVKENDNFALLTIIQYRLFSDFCESDAKYFFEKIEKYFIDKKTGYAKFDYMLLINFFQNYFNYEFDSLIFEDILEKYKIENLLSSEEKLELAYLIAAYYYKNNNALKTFEIIDKIEKYVNFDDEKKHFLKIKYHHFLNLEENSEKIKQDIDNDLAKMKMLEIIFNKKKLYNEETKKLEFVECYCVVENEN